MFAVGTVRTSSHEYMLVPFGAALNENEIVSEVVVPVAVAVTTVAHAPEAIADVPRDVVPDATVIVTVPDEGNVAVELIPVPPLVFGSRPVT